MSENEHKAAGKAKPLEAVQFPRRAEEETNGDEGTLSERALEAHEAQAAQLEQRRADVSEREADFAVDRLHRAYGEGPYMPLDSGFDENNRWMTAWRVEGEDDFGFITVRDGQALHVHLTSECGEHGTYGVAQNVEPNLADLGRHLARREEWRCPACQLAELQADMGEDDSTEAIVGRQIVMAVEATVRGILAAERDEAVRVLEGE